MTTPRLVARRPATLRRRFSGDVAGTPTVTVTDAAGDQVTTGQAVADGDEFTFALTADLLPAPDRLTVVWDVGSGWVETVQVPVDGAAYTDLASLSAGRGQSRTDEQLAEVLGEVLDRVETFIGIAYVRRYDQIVLRPHDPVYVTVLRRPRPVVRTLEVDGVAADPALLSVTDSGVCRLEGLDGTEVTIGYEHGLDRPPDHLVAAIEDTVVQLAAERFSARANQPPRADFASDNSMSWVINNPDPSRGRLFGINRVDGVFALERERWRRVVAA